MTIKDLLAVSGDYGIELFRYGSPLMTSVWDGLLKDIPEKYLNDEVKHLCAARVCYNGVSQAIMKIWICHKGWCFDERYIDLGIL